MSSACFEASNGEAKTWESEKVISSYSLKDVFPGHGFQKPVAMLPHPDVPGLWYIVEQQGKIILMDTNGDDPIKSLFANITEIVDASANEGGLLGMAFHPDFQKNGYVFLSYTRDGNSPYRLISSISRFSSPDNGKSLDSKSEKRLLNVNQPYSNHNGGNIAFDQNAYLMIGFGDGGSGGDPDNNGQNPQSLLGKLLRIDINTPKSYGIPKDNPFIRDKRFRPEIYAWGLRNPWRWSFDKKTGELWLADVGQNKWEEIDIIDAGKNYGWNIAEGNHCYKSTACGTDDLTAPIYEYNHDEGCSITGGYVYRGSKLADLQGHYVFADYCSGKIWALQASNTGKYQRQLLIESGLNIASFAQGNDGEIYVIHHGGHIYAVTQNNSQSNSQSKSQK